MGGGGCRCVSDKLWSGPSWSMVSWNLVLIYVLKNSKGKVKEMEFFMEGETHFHLCVYKIFRGVGE